ncbi:divergent polysaccharide deacetylase family protein [Cereibacter sp. SYSU M97828]|nr:divergent polysaccharide deacetylase family protein [Cereibacter flavus]
MGRGILTGVIWGCAVGVFGLAAASQLAEPPGRIAAQLMPEIRVQAPAPIPAVEAPRPAQVPVDPPLKRYARAFQDQGKPLFAVVLIDRGGALDRGALAALPFPVTFAVDPVATGAADAARIYRAAGQEVAILATGLGEAPGPEAGLTAHGKVLPEAVAVMDVEQGGFRADQDFATRTVRVLEEQGRGLLTWNNGPNTADQVARRDGLPAARIFRKLDAGGEDADVIRGYLDRAAFRAAQDGQVVVVGEARTETVQGLTLWAASGEAGSVSLAPASAVMMRPR